MTGHSFDILYCAQSQSHTLKNKFLKWEKCKEQFRAILYSIRFKRLGEGNIIDYSYIKWDDRGEGRTKG